MNRHLSPIYLLLLFAGLLCSCHVKTGIGATDLIPSPRHITYLNDQPVRLRKIQTVLDTSLCLPAEGYRLCVQGHTALIQAGDQAGLVHGRATLAQLAGVTPSEWLHDRAFRRVLIPNLCIEDWPAFPIRGFMHDTGRNYREIDRIKQEIDLLAFYKLNVFHWHLTDNPAWRIECRAYPQLNDPQFQRAGRDEGKFYSYHEIREVIAYARERGICVIPEIDMPGHSQYFDKTFGFSMASEEGKKVLETCLKEFFSEISAADCPYFHIGSDEVHVADPKGFMEFCEGIVRAHGRIPIAWYPGLSSSEGTVSQIWSETGRMAAENHFAGSYLDSYMGYLNLGNPLINTASFFLHQLCSVSEADGRALGGILCLWNDVRVDDNSRLFPHNGMPEGLLSFSESSWKGGDGYGWHNPNLLPPAGSYAHDCLLQFEEKLTRHRDAFLQAWDVRWVANAHIPWKATLYDADGQTLVSNTEAWGGCIDLNALCKANGVQPGNEPITVELSTEITVERDTLIRAWVGFDSPARSNRMSDGIGQQGHWENNARVFISQEGSTANDLAASSGSSALNAVASAAAIQSTISEATAGATSGTTTSTSTPLASSCNEALSTVSSAASYTEIFPAKPWNEPGQYRFHYPTWHKAPNEMPYTDEQFFWTREPALIPLKAGTNTITLICPRVFNAPIWIAAFVPLPAGW